jgi:hypothetical protein
VGVAAEKGAAPKFASVSSSDATKELSGFEQLETSAAMWIWSDKYVYMPGESLTLRWTIKPNGDLIPYTIVAYRINNQTGAKTYFPGGNTPTDIFGRSVTDGFDIVRLPEAEKAVLAGSGGMFPAVTIPNELGMHTLVVEIREFTGGRVVKAAYWKIGVVDGIVDIPNAITSNTTLQNTKAHRLSGVALVSGGATLTIEPGTFVIGQPGSQPPSTIVIGNTGKIHAVGTRSRPIIMTSSLPFGQRRGGDWGGIVMLGRAPSNWPQGVGNIEGLPPSADTQYGGQDAAHDCGKLKYVRLEFSGAELRPNDEINSFTWGACGTQTEASYLQASYGLDDSFEWFSGTSGADHLVSIYPRDDHFDAQIGWTGNVQYFVGVGNADNTNRGFEVDNNENDFGAMPFTKPTFYNGTLVGVGDLFQQGVDEGTVAGMYMRRGAAGSYNNIIIQNWVDAGVNIDGDVTQSRLTAGDLKFNGIVMWSNGVASGTANQLNGQVTTLGQTYFGTAPNILIANPMLRRTTEYSDPDFRPMLGSPAYQANWVLPPSGFDQSAKFSGAFGEVDWTEEWTNFIQEQDMVP